MGCCLVSKYDSGLISSILTLETLKALGIAITGDSDTVATLSSTTLSEAYVVTQASSELTDERVLAGETSVIDITDGGPGNNVTVSVAINGLDFEKLQQISTGSFVGRIHCWDWRYRTIIRSASNVSFERFYW
jgi:hypothetical protein